MDARWPLGERAFQRSTLDNPVHSSWFCCKRRKRTVTGQCCLCLTCVSSAFCSSSWPVSVRYPADATQSASLSPRPPPPSHPCPSSLIIIHLLTLCFLMAWWPRGGWREPDNRSMLSKRAYLQVFLGIGRVWAAGDAQFCSGGGERFYKLLP
eukprot:1418463-Pyramimonas_sp.AAC.1